MWSSRGRRVGHDAAVAPFPWATGASDRQLEAFALAPASLAPGVGAEERAAIEREAFARGFVEGERAAAAAASERTELVLRRLENVIAELAAARAEVVRQSERQMVELAFAVARRVLHREVSLDRDLVVAMARVAIDRLGDSAPVTVRLHPEDYDATTAARQRLQGGTVTIVADDRLPRGGCRVESEFGVVDAGIDAQLDEIQRVLLGDGDVGSAT